MTANYGPTLTMLVEDIDQRNRDWEGLEPTSETILSILAFVKHYELGGADRSPEMILAEYERYQSRLAAEANSIDWLEEGLQDTLRRAILKAVADSPGIIGCEVQEAGDSLTLWLRGVVEEAVRIELGHQKIREAIEQHLSKQKD